LTCFACEIVVRAFGTTDADDQFYLFGVPLRPYRIPVHAVAKLLEEYRVRPSAFFVYDSSLGWAPRPDARSEDGLFRANSAGLRADAEYSPNPAPGVLRVVVLGDSFTFGDEVPRADTWAYQLETQLGSLGVAAEVLNLGVNGFGMDQALLRWQLLGREYHPHVVIYGFQPENAFRNLNVFRPIYFPGTELPFSKPRFEIDGAGNLVAVNLPTLEPGRIVATLSDFASEPLSRYEYFYDERYASHWWLESRLVSFAYQRLDPPDLERRLESDPEVPRLAERIVHELASDVEAHGGRFLIVHLPRREDVANISAGRPLWYGDLLATLERAFPVIRTEASLSGAPDVLFRPRGHYAAEASRRVAADVATVVARSGNPARSVQP
jgi:hypothetical protein